MIRLLNQAGDEQEISEKKLVVDCGDCLHKVTVMTQISLCSALIGCKQMYGTTCVLDIITDMGQVKKVLSFNDSSFWHKKQEIALDFARRKYGEFVNNGGLKQIIAQTIGINPSSIHFLQ